ncbi:MAG TPA: hypothetical protein VNN80_13190 [Polyangiaceae bacterium]|nr:hypothetical protein [Polyangiaceae bacterium]
MRTETEPTYTLADRAAEVRCRGAWQPLLGYPNIEASAPRKIASNGAGIIYLVSMDTVEASQIRSFPTAEFGARPLTLTTDWYSNLWVEGPRLFYTSTTPRLLSVSMDGGGSPRLEVEAVADPAADGGAITELTPEHLYWLEPVPTETGSYTAALRRVPRSGGEAELVAELQGPFLELQRAEGGRMIAWSLAAAAVVESDGSVRYLQEEVTGVSVIGADPSAVYVASSSLVDGDGSLWRVPVDGSERQPFLPTQGFAVHHVWSDGAGGWLVQSVDYPPSGERLVKLYAVGADGSAELWACDPLVEGALELSNPIFTEGAVYFAARYSDMWQLVRVSRQGS